MTCTFDDRECVLFDFNVLVQVHTLTLQKIILILKALLLLYFLIFIK